MNEASVRDAFDQIHADRQLKEHTKRFVAEEMNHPSSRTRRSPWRPVYAAAACLVLCVILVGFHLYFTPTSVISMDINPSIELEINQFNKVIGVDGYNDDGKALAAELDVLNTDYTQALDRVMNSDPIVSCLARDEILSISVVEISGDQSEDILKYVEQVTEGRKNIGCHSMKAEDVSQAHALGLSCGKYKVYLEVRAYAPEITPEQVSRMTMRELRSLLHELQANQPTPERPEESARPGVPQDSQVWGPQNGGGHGNHHGHGQHNCSGQDGGRRP